MFKKADIKEFIFVILIIFLMIGVVGLFVYIIKTEERSVEMKDFLYSIRSETEDAQDPKDNLDKSVTEDEKFLDLQDHPVPDKEFKKGKRDPFKSFDE